MKTGTILATITLTMLLLALPASASDFMLEVFGNANEDDTINMQDVTYTELIILEYRDRTELSDAKYDDKINMQDVTQIELVILGKEKELTVIDYYGVAVTVKKPVTRVVVPYVEQADLLRALDSADKVVAVPERIRNEEAYYPELSRLPSMGTVFQPDYEAVLSLNPDVFLVYFPQWVDCEKLPGITCIFLGDDAFEPENFAQTVATYGYIFDKKDEALEYIDWNMGWINEIESRTSGLADDEKPRVFRWWFSSPGGISGYYPSYGERDTIAGGKNIAEGLPGRTGMDPEWVAEQNPEIMVVHAPHDICGYGYDDPSEMVAAREEIMNRAELANSIAVRNGDVYLIDNKHFMCANTGYAISVAYMAKWYHPDLFTDLDPQAIHQKYLTEFQGLDYDLSEQGVFVCP